MLFCVSSFIRRNFILSFPSIIALKKYVVSHQLHASAPAVLFPLAQLLHLLPHVLQPLLEVTGVLPLPGLSLSALLQLLTQADHAVSQTQHQHLRVV